jgi:hypothetical protein
VVETASVKDVSLALSVIFFMALERLASFPLNLAVSFWIGFLLAALTFEKEEGGKDGRG